MMNVRWQMTVCIGLPHVADDRDHFGRGSYYLRRNGLRPITPKEQKYIQGVVRQFGYEVEFDRMEDETHWL